MARTVLIVDDDPTQRRLLQAVVEKAGFSVLQAPDGDVGIEMATGPDANIHVMLLDLVMPGRGGMEVLDELSVRRPDLPVIVLTGSGSIDTVVSAMQKGARDFVVKPASPERIVVSIRNALEVDTLAREVVRLKKQSGGGLAFADLIGAATSMRPVIAMGERGARANIPILITGESGVGKEVVARAIRGSSERANAPFVTVNCGAIPETLVESILFGHEKGSFTGATARHAGKFQEANGGTLFLDEVGELPLDMQVKLLRVLQEGEVDPIGAKRPVTVDVRIISATNRDLAEAVAAGAFREDLFYRLNVFPIHIPPLRERREDIPRLLEHFLGVAARELGEETKVMTPAFAAHVSALPWPGNVRQLQNTAHWLTVMAAGAELTIEDLPRHDREGSAKREADWESALRQWAVRRLQEGETDLLGTVQPALERLMIRCALERTRDRRQEAARLLGWGRNTLTRKIKELGIE